jgi:hypothetical protein
MQDIQINPSDLDNTALFAHTILSKQWRTYYRNRIEYSDFYASFCIYYLTYRPKYDPTRGSHMAFTKICAFSYMNRIRRNQKKGAQTLADVSVHIELDADEQAVVDAWLDSRCMIRSVKGLADRLNIQERAVTEILTSIQDKVTERKRTRKVVLG